jgi:uncharacterized protein (DUF342 family)
MTDYELESILFYAFRYALGRSTYCVNDVTNILSKNLHVFTDSILIKINSEIIRARDKNDIGMECDRALWYELYHKIDNLIAERLSND